LVIQLEESQLSWRVQHQSELRTSFNMWTSPNS
jgi:hypothetical protein